MKYQAQFDFFETAEFDNWWKPTTALDGGHEDHQVGAKEANQTFAEKEEVKVCEEEVIQMLVEKAEEILRAEDAKEAE